MRSSPLFTGLLSFITVLPSQQQRTSSSLAGSWELVTFESRDSAGAISRPLGKRPKGILIYGTDGRVAVQLFDPDRPRFVSSDRAAGTDSEVRAAFNGSFAYYGHYSVDSLHGAISHRVEGASFPNWIGTEFIRHYRVDRNAGGERLTLTTTPQVVAGRRIVTALVWERAP
jgi:hypothetical protein